MTKEPIRYSVIIPVYNARHTLSRCLESVLAQGRDDAEAIVIDDGSTDGSRELCERYAARWSGFRFFPRPHRGVSAARNFGLSEARGEYILFLDSDDFLDARCLSTLDPVLAESDCDLLQFSSWFLVRGAVVRREYTPFSCGTAAQTIDRFSDLLCRRRVSAPWGKVYRNELIRKHGVVFPETVSLGEDKVFNLRYIVHCERFRILETPLYWTCLDNADSLSRRLCPDMEQRMEKEAKLSLEAVNSCALPAAQREVLVRALAFDRLRNVYTIAKLHRRAGTPIRERYREIARLCDQIRSEKADYPDTAFCRLCAAPVLRKRIPVIDAMAWKMAFRGIVNKGGG